jgi:AcrR family transcriptional regulator
MTEKGTKERLLDAAEQLFSDQGFSATSVRAITQTAEVNLAALNYHFGSKEALIDAVFARRIGPLNQERLRLLEELEQERPDDNPTLEELLEAFLTPALRLSRSGSGGEQFMRLMGRAHNESRDFFRKRLAKQFFPVFQRFERAFHRALPRVDSQDLFWGIHFVVGAMAHTMAHSLNMLEDIEAMQEEDSRLFKRIGKAAGSEDVDTVLARLIRFSAAGLRAEAAAVKDGGVN